MQNPVFGGNMLIVSSHSVVVDGETKVPVSRKTEIKESKRNVTPIVLSPSAS